MGNFFLDVIDKMAANVANGSVLKQIRKTLKDSHKTQYHPTVWIPLEKEWVNHTFTERLYKNVTDYKTIVELLSSITRVNEKSLNAVVRREITKYIKEMSDTSFDNLVEKFKERNPNHKTKTRQGICRIIRETSSDWDSVTLAFASRVLNLDFVIFQDINSDKELVNNTDPAYIQDTLVLVSKTTLANGEPMYNLIGYSEDDKFVDSLFSRKSLPKTVDNFVDKHNYMLSLIKTTFKMENQTLKTLYDNLRKALGVTELTQQHRKLINKITAVFLDNLEYKRSL